MILGIIYILLILALLIPLVYFVAKKLLGASDIDETVEEVMQIEEDYEKMQAFDLQEIKKHKKELEKFDNLGN